MHKLFNFKFKGETLTMCQTVYFNNPNRQALVVEDATGAPYAKVSINVDFDPVSLDQDQNQYAIKTWSENEELARYLIGERYLILTGRYVRTGLVSAPICTVNYDMITYSPLKELDPDAIFSTLWFPDRDKVFAFDADGLLLSDGHARASMSFPVSKAWDVKVNYIPSYAPAECYTFSTDRVCMLFMWKEETDEGGDE